MFNLKRGLAVLLSAAVIASLVPEGVLAAQDMQQENEVQQDNEAQQENEVQQDNEAQQENEVQQDNEAQQTDDETQTEDTQQAATLDFLYESQGEDSLAVIVGIQSQKAYTSAILHYTADGEERQAQAVEMIDNCAAFLMDVVSENRVYQSLNLMMEDETTTISLLPAQEDEAQEIALEPEEVEEVVGNSSAETYSQVEPNQELIDSVSEAAVNDLEGVSGEEITEAVEKSEQVPIEETDTAALMNATGEYALSQVTTNGKYVVVLDPGHGANDSGAVGTLNGKEYYEKTFNLKISTYTKEYLEANYSSKVLVYLTRTDDSTCPSLSDRVQYGVNKGADIFVSQHINSWTSSSVKGATVFVPINSTYNSGVRTEAVKLAQKILTQLVSLGFKDGGYFGEGSQTGNTYPDGSLADYYGIIRNCRLNNIPGIIVEHGFISNTEDLTYLTSDANLRKIAEADAKGIMEYLTGTSISTTGWVKSGGKWYYYNADGTKVTGWKKVSGTWYYMDSEGVMQTGWIKVSGKYYYLLSSGAMVKGWYKVSDKWYYFESSGAMATGWLELSDKTYYLTDSGSMAREWYKVENDWYYFGTGGAMVKGWLQLNTSWYYLQSDGKMAVGWLTVGSKNYYMKSSGAMTRGWRKINDVWYYFKSSGAMAKGWLAIGSSWYYLDSDGIMQTGWLTLGTRKYYLKSSGAMTRGWRMIDGNWYYFKSGGSMAHDEKIGSYYVNADGIWK